MTESEFTAVADATLTQIEAALEASAIDVDFELKDGGVLELEFEDGSKMIVNRHGAAREIWVAGKAGGHHFRYAEGQWRHTRDNSELFAALSDYVSAQAGETVNLRP